MATYSNLSYGSSGDEVKKMQQALINAGYDLGDTGADGQFGEKTQAAVKQYQQANGLAVDGIAGNNTLSKLYSAVSDGSTSTTQETASPTTGFDYSKYKYDATTDEAYQQALQALQQASKETPVYADSYGEQLDAIYQKILNREDFKYDLNSDMLYQQYKDQYTNLGRMAMKDTMGQAAALTGGYGSSYGQSVGQQQYDAYLQQLNDVVPELYGMAYDQYQQEGDDLYQEYAMTGDMADDEYGKYMDSLNQYWQNVDYLTGRADDAYSKGYNNWYNSYQMGTAAQSAAYAKLTELMAMSGYNPTDSELAEAGMTRQQADDYLKGWKAANPALAYRTGAISAQEYYNYTGSWPAGYAVPTSRSTYYAPKKEEETKNTGYNITTLLNTAAAGYTAAEITAQQKAAGVDTSSKAFQQDLKWALSK